MLGNEIAAILREINPMIVENFNSSHEVSIKSDESIVTKTDRQVEQILLPRLEELLPGSAVVGEESASKGSEDINKYFKNEYLWAVDPIDGTVNFASGIPLFTVSVGLFKQIEKGFLPVSGAISFPAFSEIYYIREEKVYLKNFVTHRESEIKWSGNHPVSTLLLPNHLAPKQKINRKNRFAGNLRMLGSTAADMLYVSLGKASATATIAHIWDIAAALAIANSQDLYLRDLSTGEVKKNFTKDDFLYGSPKQHWRLKKPYVLCEENDFADVQRFLKG